MNSGKAKGGLARAAALTAEQRREAARKAANARWAAHVKAVRVTVAARIAALTQRAERAEAERDNAISLLKRVQNWKALHAEIRALEHELFAE